MAEPRNVFSGRLPEPSKEPTWFPYSPKGYAWHRRILRAMFGRGGVLGRLRELL